MCNVQCESAPPPTGFHSLQNARRGVCEQRAYVRHRRVDKLGFVCGRLDDAHAVQESGAVGSVGELRTQRITIVWDGLDGLRRLGSQGDLHFTSFGREKASR